MFSCTFIWRRPKTRKTFGQNKNKNKKNQQKIRTNKVFVGFSWWSEMISGRTGQFPGKTRAYWSIISDQSWVWGFPETAICFMICYMLYKGYSQPHWFICYFRVLGKSFRGDFWRVLTCFPGSFRLISGQIFGNKSSIIPSKAL